MTWCRACNQAECKCLDRNGVSVRTNVPNSAGQSLISLLQYASRDLNVLLGSSSAEEAAEVRDLCLQIAGRIELGLDPIVSQSEEENPT